MNILIIPSWYKDTEHPYSGIFFRDQAIALGKEGATVSVLFVEGRSLRFFSLKKLKENHGQISDIHKNQIREYVWKLWNPLAQTCTGKKIVTKLHLLLFKKYVRKYGVPDIIHAHSAFMAGIIAKNIYNKYKIPYIVTEHSTRFLADRMPNRYMLKELRETHEKASKYWAVGNTLIENLQKKYLMNNVELFPNFINTSFFSHYKTRKNHSENTDTFVFFSLGNLVHVKGYDILLKAFYLSFRNNSKVKLHIGGDGTLRHELESTIKGYGLQNQVTLLGCLTKTEIREQFYASNAFVLASRVETFGVVFIEAMSAGLPIIATRSGGPEDFYDPITGYLIDKDNALSLSEAMQMMIKNINTFDSERISDYICKKYDSTILAKRAIDEYHTIIKN